MARPAGRARPSSVLAVEDGAVAVGPPQRPRHPDRGVAPDRGAVRLGELLGRGLELQDVGDHERHHAVGVLLLGGQVEQPVGEERPDVEQERRGGREDGDVAGPAEPLVALRAVGGDVEEVALRAPDDVAVELVQQRVGALEGPVRRRSECTTTASRPSAVSVARASR